MDCCTAAYNEPNGDLQFHPKRIAQNYVRTWFVIDTAGCLPINYIILIMKAYDTGALKDSSGGRANRTLRLLRLFRLLKLLRLLHPDFSLNLSIKGTKQHARIEAAFKRLAGLRDERAG